MQAFENAQIQPEFMNERGRDLMDINILLKEKPQRTFDADLEWSMARPHPRVPLPLPAHISPGGTITYEDRNFLKRGDVANANVACSSFLHPTDDFSARFTLRRPNVFRRKDPHDKEAEDLVFDAFNARRLSSVFATSGPGASQTPGIWNERAGFKLGLERALSRNSYSVVNAVVQQVKTRDDSNALATRGHRLGPRGEPLRSGPPTTLSGSGMDRSIHAQLCVIRDTTFLDNAGVVGSRDLLEVNQGLGLGNGTFNRCVFLPFSPNAHGEGKTTLC
jgi:outer membrane protein assembly factor BamA